MSQAWDSDDKLFVFVLIAAVIGQTATHKNVLGSTAAATMGLFSRQHVVKAAPQPTRTPTVRRSSSLWAGTVAFFKTAAATFSKRQHAQQSRTSNVRSLVKRSLHLSPLKPRVAPPRTWHIGFDRLSWPWKKKTTRSTPQPGPASPGFAVVVQPQV
jgi:hypothetical protein